MTKEIRDMEDIRLLVHSFYEKVQKDELIGHIFNEVIAGNWPEHLEKMCRFWQTVLLNERSYQGRPFPPHMKLAVDQRHFERWLKLFSETIREHFHGEKAEEARWRAEKMAEMFSYKLAYFRNTKVDPIQ